MFLVMLLFALFGSTFVFGEAAVWYIRPVFFVMIRFFLAGTLILGYQWFRNRASLVVKFKDWWPLVQTSFFLFFFAYVIEFWVLQFVSGAKVSLIWNLSPFVTAVFAYFWFKELMTSKKFLGLAIGFLGFFPLLMAPSVREDMAGTVFNISWPEAILIIAVFASALGWILFRRMMDRGYQTLVINGYSMIIAGFLSLFTSLMFEGPWNPVPVLDWYKGLWYIFYMTLVGNLICFNLYGYLLKRYSTTYLSFCGFMTPLFAAVIQYFYLGNAVGKEFIITLVPCHLLMEK